ncbi:branched-chain amino acid ABC transporter permease [Nitratireductor sp. ZSWI3]|uniref:branched-chain amino acid ABC transporter permease n=1 Tax=Nitratireductor sp. ZSWI3 TaxID=2966359 RepID=UPI00214F7644|nr:branched-chain amino acid ABC transporter permease [Nitratireductor sp. ZSWI3]MCR4266645.1 branched-chain amino acid ABC transporter permease [Nitratireductor sp. ZSWI3]
MQFVPARSLLPLSGLALALVAAPFLLPNSFALGVAILAILNAAVAVGLNLFVGSAGQISLGHAAFFGIGAYAAAILSGTYGFNGAVALLAGAVASGLLAHASGRTILRLSGHYLAMATLGVGIIVYLAINQEIGFTGGPDGKAVPPFRIFGAAVVGEMQWYWIAAIFLLIVTWMALNLVETGYGRSLGAIHASEHGARAVGIDVAAVKTGIFVLSAVLASVAGSLYAFHIGFITPSEAGFLKSVELVIMIVVGGLGSVFGAILGALLITALPQFLTGFHDYEQLVFGLLLMLVAMALRRGIVPTLATLAARWAR